MTKEEAVSVINGEKTIDSTLGTQTSQPEEQVETVTEENTTPSEETKTEVPEDNDGNNEAVEDVPEKDVEDKTSRKKKTYTPLQKQQYAFKMQKARWRKAEERNAQQAEEIEKLKAELEKYKGLTLEDFGNDQQKYLDYQVDQRMGRERVNSMTEQLDYQRRQMEMQEASEIANERLMNCYPDEVEREKYQNLIQNAETNFAEMHPEIGYEKFSDFLLSEKDRSVLNYLQDSDNAPKLIRHFIHKPEAALKIMTMRNPYNKFIELKQLENRMMQHERIVKNKMVPQKKVLPDTGKTLNNNTIDTGFDWSKPMTKADAIAYINKQKSL